MSRAGIPDRICGCPGCRAPATAVIGHPEHGERTVCADCAQGFEVVRDV